MAAPRVVGPHDGQLAFLGGTSARFIIDGNDAGIVSLLWSTPCNLAPWPRQCTDIIVRRYSFVLEGHRSAARGCRGIWQSRGFDL